MGKKEVERGGRKWSIATQWQPRCRGMPPSPPSSEFHGSAQVTWVNAPSFYVYTFPPPPTPAPTLPSPSDYLILTYSLCRRGKTLHKNRRGRERERRGESSFLTTAVLLFIPIHPCDACHSLAECFNCKKIIINLSFRNEFKWLSLPIDFEWADKSIGSIPVNYQLTVYAWDINRYIWCHMMTPINLYIYTYI